MKNEVKTECIADAETSCRCQECEKAFKADYEYYSAMFEKRVAEQCAREEAGLAEDECGCGKCRDRMADKADRIYDEMRDGK